MRLSNISRGKDNQPMESGQLIKYNKSNIFLEKYYKNYSKEASPRLFYENQN